MKTNKRIFLFAIAVIGVMVLLGGLPMLAVSGIAYAAAGLFTIAGKSSKELKERRADVLTLVDTLNQKLADETEARDFNEEEQREWDGYQKELRKLNKAIEDAETLEESQKRAAGNRYSRRQQEREKKDVANYSFTRSVSSLMNKQPLDGFEAEMHQEGQKEARDESVQLHGGGIVIPRMILDPNPEKRDMVAGTATAGGNAIATDLGDFINYLYNSLVLTQLGADFMTGLVGNISFPTETAVASATWEGENDENAESAPTVGKLTMTPKRLGTFTNVSNQLLQQTSPSIEARIRRQLVTAIQLGIEAAAINGSGTGAIPTGILNTSGIGSVAGGTDGSAISWNDMIDLESAVAVANADIGKLGYLMNAATRGKLKKTRIESGAPEMVWPVGAKEVNGYNVGVTNAVPADLTKGSGTDLSAVLFGNFEDLMVGMWGGIEILPDPFTKGTQGLIRLIVNSFADIGIGHAASFAAKKDAITS